MLVVGGLCRVADKDKMVVWSSDQWLGHTRHSFSFETQDTGEVLSVLSVSARKQGGGREKKVHFTKFCANCLVPAMTCREVFVR